MTNVFKIEIISVYKQKVVTDSTQVLYMINTGRSSNKCCMSWLREISWLCFVFNLDLFAVYINTKDNLFADALSRVDDNFFFFFYLYVLPGTSCSA